MEPPADDFNGFRHPQTLENRSPSVVVAAYSSVVQFLQQYGWFLVFGVVLLFFIKQRLQKYLASRPSAQSSSSEQDLHRYDSETAMKRQHGFESSRRRLQETMDAAAARFAEARIKKEEEKRKLKLADWQNHLEGKGYKSKYRPQESTVGPGSASSTGSVLGSAQKKKPSTYRTSDYNPLTGSSSTSSSYRPPARRGGGG